MYTILNLLFRSKVDMHTLKYFQGCDILFNGPKRQARTKASHQPTHRRRLIMVCAARYLGSKYSEQFYLHLFNVGGRVHLIYRGKRMRYKYS
jgi:hypothetical protein